MLIIRWVQGEVVELGRWLGLIDKGGGLTVLWLLGYIVCCFLAVVIEPN